MPEIDLAHRLARAHLATRTCCAPFASTLTGMRQPVAGAAGLKRGCSRAVVSEIGEMAEHASAETAALTGAVIGLVPHIDWWNAYDPDQPVGRGMQERTAACLLSGPGGPYGAEHGRAGFFYLRDGVEYAPHRHRPQEIYAVVAGRARFWAEGDGWRWAGAGDVIHTAPGAWHGMETLAGPVLILWCWIGEEFEGRPEIMDDTGALPA